MNLLDEYIRIAEFKDKVRDEVNDKFYVDVPEKAIILIIKRYDEFKKELDDK